MKYVISAGGTGGHVFPAISILEKIKKEDKEAEILYIGTTDRMEKDIIPSLGINYLGVELKGLNRKKILSNFSVLKKYILAKIKIKKVLKEFNPDIVIGVGGYITLPVITVASSLKIPTLIHEQNSIPGLSNRLLSRKANTICVSLPGSVNYFPKYKTVYTGNPRSEEVLNVKSHKKSKLGFNDDLKLVVFVMGSLGSMTMTKKIIELIPNFSNKNYQVLIITGEEYYPNYKSIKLPDNVKILPFYKNLLSLLKSVDLMVSRAGASTIAEITAIGLPAILVPSPYVTNNHQFKNAKELKDKTAAVLLEEKDFDSNTILKEIDKLFDDSSLYSVIKNNSLELGVSDSSSRIYEEIKKLIGD